MSDARLQIELMRFFLLDGEKMEVIF
jgi:hypothetical protein